jgi:hypothetical protein
VSDTVKLLELLINESRASDARVHRRLDVIAENQRHIMQAVAAVSDDLCELRDHNQDQHNRAGARIKDVESAQKAIHQHPALQFAANPAE